MAKKGERPKPPVEVSPWEFKIATLFIQRCTTVLVPMMSEGKEKIDVSCHAMSAMAWGKQKKGLKERIAEKSIGNDDKALTEFITAEAEATAKELYEKSKSAQENTKSLSHAKGIKNTRSIDFGIH